MHFQGMLKQNNVYINIIETSQTMTCSGRVEKKRSFEKIAIPPNRYKGDNLNIPSGVRFDP